MVNTHRFQIAVTALSGACALLAFSALALAQGRPRDVSCKATETQAECHARLKCKADEELEACQKRLLRCRADETLADCEQRVGGGSAGDDSRGGPYYEDDRSDDRGADDRSRDRDAADRGRERDSDSDRQDRDDDGDRGDRGGRDRGNRSRGRRGGRGGGGGRDFEANKTFGLGLELGEPTGLTGKYFVSESAALDFGIGWIYRHYYYGDGLHLYADYLFHPVSLVSAQAFELPLYIGGGLRFWDFDYCDNRVCEYDGTAIGLRIPVGIAFDFNNVPLDIFLQLVPVIDFVNGDYYRRYGDRAHFGIDLSAGIRFWFK